jgi:rubrerythrin
MDDIHLFLSHAIALEREAARRYDELADTMRTFGNGEVEQFFRQMGSFARAHLADAMARGGFRAVPELAHGEYQWPDGTSPEQAAWSGIDAFTDLHSALHAALDGEQRSHAYYAAIAAATRNPRVKAMAEEFAGEEAEHVAEMEKWIARTTA